jgi:UDP-N-acetylglucosamine--N-acetylmuramyl-(pentapeptide) pyrophosphoryl-undecaprenol N-acetylglucosamine transferase
MKILIAGGGTGGHVFPGIAVAEELKRIRPDCEVVFVGTRRGLEAQAVPEAGFTIRFLAGSGFSRGRWWTWPWSGLVNLLGLVQAVGLVIAENPKCVLGTGGYVSAPIAFAARLFGRPLILQEQNSVPGLANRMLARVASEVHLSFLEARTYFVRRDHLKVTGNPVRAHILTGDRDTALREFKLAPGRPTLFVFGGSLGASRINEAALDMLRRLKGRLDLQCLLVTGRGEYEKVKAAVLKDALPATVLPFVKKMHMAYAATDLVVSRSGAMTLAEIAVCGLPAILVPYPHAAHDHQQDNAANLVERGAAVLIPDAELNGERLAKDVAHLLADRQALSRMSANARLFARPDAAERIARSLLRWAEGRGEVAAEEPAEGGGR